MTSSDRLTNRTRRGLPGELPSPRNSVCGTTLSNRSTVTHYIARIYVASSWRNAYYPEVVKRLREYGHEVYDFRISQQGGHGFHWTDIDPNCADCTFAQYSQGLTHPAAEKQFANDVEALEWANTCVLVLSCGRSAHMEAGWCKGRGMKTIVYVLKMEEPELMYKLFDAVTDRVEQLISLL